MPAPPIRVRKAEANDLPQVRDCLAIAFEQYHADYTPAMFETTVPTLEGLHNRAAARLLEAAESELRSLGCAAVTLDTTAPLHRAMKFYQKHGYRQSGTRHAKLGMELIEHRKDL